MMTKACKFLGALLILTIPLESQAHKRWFMPNEFTLSAAEHVAVDFTASNNIFYPDKPMPVADVEVIPPTASAVALVNRVSGKRRGSFDLLVDQPGTYRIFYHGAPVHFLSYSLPNKAERIHQRGDLSELRSSLPEQAKDVEFAEAYSLIETYITLGKPSQVENERAPKGLSVEFQSHPSELYSDERARFTVLLDGEPAAGIAIDIVSDGSRYRNDLAVQHLVSDARGQVAVDWDTPGRYLLEISSKRASSTAGLQTRYDRYYLTVEVQAP